MTQMVNSPLIQQLISTAHQLRLGHEAQGSLQLTECIDKLIELQPSLTNNQQIMPILSSMLAAQEKHDWLGLADALEYELPLLLS
ncbi:hypothetical protein [Shewanella pneumatophori]|uniref:Uncharacterized protein n=1 Tax=Shewanella pneumatophori TaxID=314092 RepID=A0A9X2CH19_9GAMM|nr:hypothetical protein [Shewanella pneumatophori]MCL1139666.1 hypothetical protein [Shewanella pneumatophori]